MHGKNTTFSPISATKTIATPATTRLPVVCNPSIQPRASLLPVILITTWTQRIRTSLLPIICIWLRRIAVAAVLRAPTQWSAWMSSFICFCTM